MIVVIRVGGDGHDDLHVHLGEPVSERPDLGQARFPHAGQGPGPPEDTALLMPGDDLETGHLSRPGRSGPVMLAADGAGVAAGARDAPARSPQVRCQPERARRA